jgi:hypothetical protein
MEVKMKYGFVYIWRDRKHNRYYVGSHWGTEDDGYICSSNRMRKAYRRRQDDFRRRILKRIYTSREDTFTEEQRYLDIMKIRIKLGVSLKASPRWVENRYYNLHFNTKHHWSTEENRRTVNEKISISVKSLHNDLEYRKKYERGLKKRVTTNWSNPKARGEKIARIKKQKFQEKRKQGLPCFEEQAAENMRIAAKKRGWCSPIRGKPERDPTTGRFI